MDFAVLEATFQSTSYTISVDMRHIAGKPILIGIPYSSVATFSLAPSVYEATYRLKTGLTIQGRTFPGQ